MLNSFPIMASRSWGSASVSPLRLVRSVSASLPTTASPRRPNKYRSASFASSLSVEASSIARAINLYLGTGVVVVH